MKKMMDRTRHILVGCAIAFALYSLAGFFLVPYLIKTVVADRLTEALGRKASVEKASFNPYSFSLRVQGFKLMEPDGSEVFASFGELVVNLQGRSLIKGGLTVKELTLDRPYLRAVHNEDSSYNFTDLIPTQKAQATDEKPGMKFSFNNIRITNGNVDFLDLPKNKTHTVTEISVAIPFISSIPSEVEIFVKPSFSASVNGSPFELVGESKPFADSFETSIDIDLKDLSIPEYLAYSPVPLKFRMPSGTLSAGLALSYVQYKDKGPELTLKGLMKFRALVFEEPGGAAIAKFPAVDIEIASIDAFARTARIASVVFDRPDISLAKKKDGVMNVTALFASPGPGEKAADDGADEDKASGQFVAGIDSVKISKAALSYSDLSMSPAFRVSFEPVNLSVTGFSTAPGKKASIALDCRKASGESIRASGAFSASPVEADIDVRVDSLDLRPVQPFIDNLASVTLTKGSASAEGKVSAGYAENRARLSYRGSARVTGFSAVDKARGESLAGWGSLTLDGIEFDLAPGRVVVGAITLSDFYSNITRGADGKINLLAALAAPVAKGAGNKASGQASSGGSMYTRVDSVAFKGANVDFRDSFISPSFRVALVGLSGTVKGLFLDGSKLADMKLAGKIDKYAPFEASGKINPKKDELLVDMRIQLGGYDLSSVTPYSGRYIGYRIDKGKLFLDLDYRIDKRKLDAENGVLIDQITLGEKVESPQATSLPVSFAISLLKDRRGQIKLDVPLSGSLDDPEFSVAAIVVQIIFNLIEKAITSPFALLGSIFGGGADLGFVEFDPGSSVLSGEAVDKLASLAEALFERPGLKLDIEGFTSDEDAGPIGELKFARALKAEKLKRTGGGEAPAASLDAVSIGAKERDAYLYLAYKEADFPKEKNFLGLTKRLPSPELERLLRAHLAANDDDFRALAQQRSDAVKDYLLASGKVEPERVFVRWPGTLRPGKKEGARDARVEFRLE